MDLTLVHSAKMNIVRTPRELEFYRSKVKMEIFLELKKFVDVNFGSKFNRADCARIATEAVNQLCGDKPAGNPLPVPLPQGIRSAVEDVIRQMRTSDGDLRIAASFVRWAKAAAQLMLFKNSLAEVNLLASLDLNPKNAFAYTSLAYLAGFKGEYAKAIDLARKAVDLDPELPEAWTELANAYQATNQEELMQSTFRKAQELIEKRAQTIDTQVPR
jgi:tetratricopeptide (TPR) repeat protein